jgi:hypothetical protein
MPPSLSTVTTSFRTLQNTPPSLPKNKQEADDLTHTCLISTTNKRNNKWSSGQSSWLQIQRSGFDSRRYMISSEVLGLERGPLSLVSTIEGLTGRKSRGSGLEMREYGRGDPSR